MAPALVGERLAETLVSLRGDLLLPRTSRTTRPLELALDAAVALIGSYA